MPLGAAASDFFLRDVTSLGALLLVYGIPCGVSVAAAAWLAWPATAGVISACLGILLVSAVHPSQQLASYRAGPVLLVAAVALAGLLLVEQRARSRADPAPSPDQEPLTQG